MMKVKIVYGDDMRRWRYPANKRYQSLTVFIKDTFKFSDDSSFFIQFEDDEMDRVTITSEIDFNDAFACAEQEQRKSLKIFVNQGPIEQTHAKVSVDNESVRTEPTKDESVKTGENIQRDWRASALNFLQNEEIQALLPQLARRVVIGLRGEQVKTAAGANGSEEKQMNGFENEDQDDTAEAKDFATILTEILSEEQFKPITSHEIYVSKFQSILPCIAGKAAMYQHVLLTFNEDAIAAWVPHLIQILIRGLLNFEKIQFDIELEDGNLASFMPQWCAFANNCQNDKPKSQVHAGVQCDECDMCPIVGARYKCAVCGNYDLCGKCEAACKHDSNHPLIKFNVPISDCSNFEYSGLHETVQNLGGPHNIFGPRHGRHGHGGHGRGHGRRGPHPRFGGRGRGRGGCGRRWNPHTPGGYGPLFAPPFGPYGGCPARNQWHTQERRHSMPDTPQMNDNISLLNQCTQSFGDSMYSNENMNDQNSKQEKKEAKRKLKDLKKYKRKISGMEKKIEKKINKINAKQDKFFSKKEKKQGKKKVNKSYRSGANKHDEGISCMCGSRLSKVSAHEAYSPSVFVTCDVCDKRVDTHALVYHCSDNRNVTHPNGYDMCGQCVALQIGSFLPEAPKVADVSNDNNDVEEDADIIVNDDSGDNMEIEMNVDDLYDEASQPAPVNANEVVKNDDVASVLDEIFGGSVANDDANAEIVILDDSEDDIGVIPPLEIDHDAYVPPLEAEVEIIAAPIVSAVFGDVLVPPVEEEVQVEDKQDNFVYLDAVNNLAAMGFPDSDLVRALLLQHRGQIERVIEALLQ